MILHPRTASYVSQHQDLDSCFWTRRFRLPLFLSLALSFCLSPCLARDILRRQQQDQRGERRGHIERDANKVLDHGGRFLHCMPLMEHAHIKPINQSQSTLQLLSFSSLSLSLLSLSLSSLSSPERVVVVPPASRAPPPVSPTGSNLELVTPGRLSFSQLSRSKKPCCCCCHCDSFCNWGSLPLCRLPALNPPAGLDLLKQSSLLRSSRLPSIVESTPVSYILFFL